MSRVEARNQYNESLKIGTRTRKDCVLQGRYPYLPVLDELLDESMAVGREELGILNVPSERIVGTKTVGRRSAFASDFMPLLPESSEFAAKWIALCEAHLSDEGIRDPVRCYEYLGRFYVEEGNKRVSVLKSYGSPTIPADVTRILPAWSEDREVRQYYEFLEYYRVSHLYLPVLNISGGYRRMTAALGFSMEQEWTEQEKRDFASLWYSFSPAAEKCFAGRGPETVGNAFLTLLELYGAAKLKDMSPAELSKALESVRPDVEVLGKEQPITLSTEESEEQKKLFVTRLMDSIRIPGRLNAAFIHECAPEKSAWVTAHEQGRASLEQSMNGRVTTSVSWVEDPAEVDALFETAAEGAQVIFATSPRLMGACRRFALKHPEIKVLNCSVSMPFPEVRTYYSRIYEGKFISGALAGAMTENGRVGYVGSSPIYGVPAGINAFALGARLTNPGARVFLRWSAVSEDPVRDLLNDGVDMIANRDMPLPSMPQERWGLCRVGSCDSLLPVGSPQWNWGQMYAGILRNILNGGWDELSYRNSGRAVNYWWGISSGAVDIRLSETIPEGMKELARILKEGIASGSVVPFSRPLNAQDGSLLCDGEHTLSPGEILHMDRLCRYVDGSIPSFEELREIARPLVRLLGIYRDSIPPEQQEEKA